MKTGVILDVETTGIQASRDKIIEIGLLEFRISAENKPHITRLYGGLQDPGEPLSAEIIKLTGLTDATLEGQTIDWAFVRQVLEGADVVVAHNASFDREFVEARAELHALERTLHWACTMKHVDWEGRGFRTRAP